MSKKYKVTLLVTLILFIAMSLIPSYFKVVFYIKHLSAFLFVSIIVFLLLESQAKAFNKEATSEKQIKRNNTIKLIVLVIILSGVSLLQIRYITVRDTYVELQSNIYDVYGNIIYEQDFMYDDIEIIESSFTEDTLTIVIKETMTGQQEVYFYPVYSIKSRETDKNMRFVKITTIYITYDDQQRMEHITQLTTEQIVKVETGEIFVYTIKNEYINDYTNDLFSQINAVYEGFESRNEEVDLPNPISNLELSSRTRYYSEKEDEYITVYLEDMETGVIEKVSKSEVTVSNYQVDIITTYYNDDSEDFESAIYNYIKINQNTINSERKYDIGGQSNTIGNEHTISDDYFLVIITNYHDLGTPSFGNTKDTDRYYHIEREESMYVVTPTNNVTKLDKEENYIISTSYVKRYLDWTETSDSSGYNVYNSSNIKSNQVFNEFVGSISWNDQQRYIIYQKNPFFLPYYELEFETE